MIRQTNFFGGTLRLEFCFVRQFCLEPIRLIRKHSTQNVKPQKPKCQSTSQVKNNEVAVLLRMAQVVSSGCENILRHCPMMMKIYDVKPDYKPE